MYCIQNRPEQGLRSGKLAKDTLNRTKWGGLLFAILLLFFASQLRGADAVEAFKEYLASPPSIAKIIYSEASCNDTLSRTLVGGWCGNSFYVRELTGAENLDVPISRTNQNHSVLYVGRLGDSRWQIAGYELKLSIQPNLSKPDPYAVVSDAMQAMLGGAINLGSQHVQPGTFVWSGNKFTAKASPWARQFGIDEFQGEIIVTGGLVTRMIITGSGTWDYKYSAAANLPLGIPAEIICGGSDHCTSKILIKQIVPAMPSDEMRIFDPQARIDKSVASLTVLSNSVVIKEPVRNSRLVARMELGTVSGVKPQPFSTTKISVIIAIMLLTTFSFAILAIIRRRARKPKRPN